MNIKLGLHIASRKRGREESMRFLPCWRLFRTEGSEGAICCIANRDAGYVSTLVKHVEAVTVLV